MTSFIKGRVRSQMVSGTVNQTGPRGPQGPPGPVSMVNMIDPELNGNVQVSVEISKSAFLLIENPDPKIMYFLKD